MMKNQRFSFIVLAAFCAALPALAQIGTGNGGVSRIHSPYTIEFKTTHVQTLANGTIITTETKDVMALDQNMRRMNAVTDPPHGDRPAVTNVHVNDPATGEDISWSSLSQVAHDIRRPVGEARHGCWATPDGRHRANFGGSNANVGGMLLQPLQPPAGAAVPAVSPQVQGDVAPRVFTSGGGGGAGISGAVLSSAPSGSNMVPQQKPDLHNVVHEDLGADTIMGVSVRGSRTTTTTPAGAMGNDQPLVRTDEVWMAPSLGMALRSITEDPRMGKMVREVVSVDLNNPDPALFQPPAGYQLETEEMQPVACPQ